MHTPTFRYLSKHSTKTQEAILTAQSRLTYQWVLSQRNVTGNHGKTGVAHMVADDRMEVFFLQVVGLLHGHTCLLAHAMIGSL